jgi:uncharacterized membrane protein
MATGPDLRIGDADREAAAARLRESYAQGRLTLEEFNQRIDAAFAARTQSQLHQVTSDLPHVTTPSVPLPVTASGSRQRNGGREHPHGGRARPRFGYGLISMVAACLLLTGFLLLLVNVVFPDLRGFPLPGKLGILLAIFAALRGMLRRVLGGGRGRGYGPRRRR